jgi:hypothetical protein
VSERLPKARELCADALVDDATGLKAFREVDNRTSILLAQRLRPVHRAFSAEAHPHPRLQTPVSYRRRQRLGGLPARIGILRARYPLQFLALRLWRLRTELVCNG